MALPPSLVLSHSLTSAAITVLFATRSNTAACRLALQCSAQGEKKKGGNDTQHTGSMFSSGRPLPELQYPAECTDASPTRASQSLLARGQDAFRVSHCGLPNTASLGPGPRASPGLSLPFLPQSFLRSVVPCRRSWFASSRHLAEW
ncbi:hypothetical protein LZ31DRAFT_48875 [Colletotrichum somersetense]|nr:hypothetical protein LZ31DRAFT_48875 [Colletotrichum somersetense]